MPKLDQQPGLSWIMYDWSFIIRPNITVPPILGASWVLRNMLQDELREY